jgi:CTP:molybdopterin cytidylyltransferase MocA
VTVAAILMAGGESRRMGSPKPLLDWGGVTLIEYQLQQLREAGADNIVAVLGHEADTVRPLVRKAGARAILNELYREGRASSVRVGAAGLGDDTEAVVVLNVDQPRPADVTRRLLHEHRARRALVTLPMHAGKRGHPVILDGSLLSEMREVREDTQGLRAIVERHSRLVHEVEFDSPVVLLDLNEPGDYETARRMFFEVAP